MPSNSPTYGNAGATNVQAGDALRREGRARPSTGGGHRDRPRVDRRRSQHQDRTGRDALEGDRRAARAAPLLLERARPRATGCSPATRTSARRSRRRRCSATTRSWPPNPDPAVPVPAVVQRPADPHGVPPTDEPVVLPGGRSPSWSRARASWPGPRSSAVLADGGCDYMSTFGDRFPVAGVPRLDGPADGRRRLLRVARPPHVRRRSASEPAAVAQMTAAWGELAAYWTEHARRPAGAPARPRRRLRHDDEPGHARRRADARRRHPRHHGHADARQPRHPEEPARLAAVAPRHPPRGHRRASSPTRRSIPSAVEEFLRAYPIVVDGPQGHPRRRLPRLPDEEGRHGPAHDPGRPRATRGCSRTPTR